MKSKVRIGMYSFLYSLVVILMIISPLSAQEITGTVVNPDSVSPSVLAETTFDTLLSKKEKTQDSDLPPGLPDYQLGILAFDEIGSTSTKETPILGPMLARLLWEKMRILPRVSVLNTVIPAVSPFKKAVFIKSRDLGNLMDDEARIQLDPELERDRRNSDLRAVSIKIKDARNALAKARADKQRHETDEKISSSTSQSPNPVFLSNNSNTATAPSTLTTMAAFRQALGKNRRKVVWKTSADGPLLQNPQGLTTGFVAERENLDAVIHGTVSRQGREFILEIRYFERTTGSSTLIHTSRGLISRPQDTLDACIPIIESHIAGGDCARIELVSNAESVRFYQDFDTSFSAESGLVPEPLLLDPVFYVYQPVRMSIIAISPEKQSIRQNLQVVPDAPVTRYRETFAFPARTTDSFSTMKSGIDPSLKGLLASGAKPGYASTFLESRNRFYNALGLFVISLPVALLGSSIFQMYLDGYERSNQQRMLTGSIISGIFFGSSVLAGTGLGIHAGISLAAYIGSAH